MNVEMDVDKKAGIRASVIDQTAKDIGQWAEGKGFRDDWNMAKAIGEPQMNAVLGMKLMLVVSEASEALETLRDHGARSCTTDGNFTEELADIVIRVMDMAEMLEVSLGDEIIKKMKVNEGRAHKHGRRL
jgi:NTP pyrophosphatase (non-canonical NTP hydrolase)